MALEFLSQLHKASRQLTVHIERGNAEYGLSSAEGHLLTYLHSYAPTPVGELVRVFGFKQSTFTSILDRLEQPGYIRRELNPQDRRSFLIHITDEGRAVAGRITGQLVAIEDAIRSHVSARDVAGFRAVMGAIGDVTRVELRGRA